MILYSGNGANVMFRIFLQSDLDSRHFLQPGHSFPIDGDIVIEVGGQDKGFGQIAGQDKAYVAADDIEYAFGRKIPLWAFGFLY